MGNRITTVCTQR
ncbi:unnamed protein product, partial [Rotaria sp. Silwood2]